MKILKSILIFLLFFSSLFANEGIKYSKIVKSYFWYNQNIHLIEIDPNLYEIKAVKAKDISIGRETLLSINKRHGAIAAINGGFFSNKSLLDGRDIGALKIENWYALPLKPRGCIGWNKKNEAIFDRIFVDIEANYNNSSFLIDGLNCSRNIGEVILFNFDFHRSTLTTTQGEEIIIQNNIITDIKKNKGSSIIPTNGYVLSLHKDHPLCGFFQIGSAISFKFNILSKTNYTIPQDWKKCDYIVGGAPLLIINNQKITDFSSEILNYKFVNYKHARTALGILPNGNWLFVTIDKNGTYDGMSLYELAEFMSELNCTHALNLNGGKNSTMIYEGELKNSPFDDENNKDKIMRKIASAIIVLPKK